MIDSDWFDIIAGVFFIGGICLLSIYPLSGLAAMVGGLCLRFANRGYITQDG